MNRTRPKQIVIRASEKEFDKIKTKVEKSTLSQNEYLLKSVLEKEIVVIDGVRDLTIEIKRIGTNLNQIAKAVNEGRADCAKELSEMNEELRDVWQLLRRLIQKQA